MVLALQTFWSSTITADAEYEHEKTNTLRVHLRPNRTKIQRWKGLVVRWVKKERKRSLQRFYYFLIANLDDFET